MTVAYRTVCTVKPMKRSLSASTVMTRRLDPDREGEARRHQIRMPDAEWEAAQQEAPGGNVSALIRALLAEYVRKQQQRRARAKRATASTHRRAR